MDKDTNPVSYPWFTSPSYLLAVYQMSTNVAGPWGLWNPFKSTHDILGRSSLVTVEVWWCCGT